VTEEAAFAKSGGKERTGGGIGPFYLYTRQTGTWTSLVSGWDTDKERDIIVPYCPALVADSDFPPTLMIHGDNDTDVPHSQSVQMQEALTKAGVESELVTLPGYPHAFDFKMPKDPETVRVNRLVVDFFKEKL
jgi:dipeptidyl aminopeptidase/acylaminoacyl peptidase